MTNLPDFIRCRLCEILIIVAIFFLAYVPEARAKDIPASDIENVTVVVVKNFPPYYLVDAKGRPQGFAIDVMNELADIANLKVKYIVKDSWKQTAVLLQKGDADLIPNLGISEERSKFFDFSKPVETSPISIAVRAEITDINSVADLAGKYVGVIRFNIGEKIAESLGNVSTIIYEQPDHALIGLLAGHVDAVIYPKYVMQKVARDARLGQRIRMIIPPLSEIKRAIAVRKGNSVLLAKLNKAIDIFIPSDKYNAIYEKWYGKPIPFFTVNKILLIMSIVIVLIVILLVWWRYHTIITLNNELSKTIEARKHAEQELIKSNVLLENVIDSTPDLIFVKDNNLRIILCNKAYAEAVGKTPEEMLGFTDIENGWDPELVNGNPVKNIHGFESDDKQVLTGQAIHNPEAAANMGGKTRIFDTYKLPLRDANQNIIGLLGFARDVTEQKQAEVDLLKSEVFSRTVIETLPDLVWLKDKDGVYLACNPKFERLLGVKESILIGKTDYDFFESKQADFFRENDRRAMAAGEPCINEETLTYIDDGHTETVETIKTPILDADGNVNGVLGIARDISDRKNIENTLQRKNIALLALSLVNEAVIHYDKEQNLLDEVCRIITEVAGYRLAWVGFKLNDKMKTIKVAAQSGYEKDYLGNINLSWSDTDEGQGPTGTAIRTGKANFIRNIMEDPRYEMWRDSAVERGYCSSIALPLKSKGKAFGALNIYAAEPDAFDKDEVHFLQDLTDDLAYGIESLRSQNERKKLDLQLQQAQKMESIGFLTGGIAHDFNNILVSILGFTNLALDRFVTKEQGELHEYLTEVVHAGERARDLIQQMLVFSRTGVTRAIPLSVLSIVDETQKLLQAAIPSSIHLTAMVNNSLPDVVFDPVQLQQIIMNLCINARDALNEKGHIKIQTQRKQIVETSHLLCAACHNIIEAGDYIELSVEDDGAGMDNETLNKIFEPFFTTKDVGKGTGMGLSMVHGIMHQHGGHILVKSEIGTGTTIQLLLPVADISLATEVEQAERVEVTSGNTSCNIHILVVDDEESVGRFMGDLLESRGYKTTIMSNSVAALELFSNIPDKFDLLVTDQTMPDMSGSELAQQCLSIRADLPVILSTGYSENIDREKAMQMGIRGYIEKPMKAAELFSLIETLLTNRKS